MAANFELGFGKCYKGASLSGVWCDQKFRLPFQNWSFGRLILNFVWIFLVKVKKRQNQGYSDDLSCLAAWNLWPFAMINSCLTLLKHSVCKVSKNQWHFRFQKAFLAPLNKNVHYVFYILHTVGRFLSGEKDAQHLGHQSKLDHQKPSITSKSTGWLKINRSFNLENLSHCC